MGYENGLIYRIVCNVSGKQYIGSTTQPLSKRLSRHKSNFRLWKSGYVYPNGKCHDYMKSFEIIENGDYEIVLIEAYPCESKYELERRERHYIDTLECVNKVRPAQTREERLEQMKQYREENKEIINEQIKQYYQENKEHIQEYKKQYQEENKEKIKERKKQYYEENKEKLNERMKQYREENKKKLNEQRKQKHECECGVAYTQSNKARHLKAKKHQEWAQQQTTRNQP